MPDCEMPVREMTECQRRYSSYTPIATMLSYADSDDAQRFIDFCTASEQRRHVHGLLRRIERTFAPA
jgi:hypothetical protein